jgi:hypothetical protein
MVMKAPKGGGSSKTPKSTALPGVMKGSSVGTGTVKSTTLPGLMRGSTVGTGTIVPQKKSTTPTKSNVKPKKTSTKKPAQLVKPSEAVTEYIQAVPSSPAIDYVKQSASVIKAVKTATPDIVILDNEQQPIEYITDLIFEDIGGHELLNIARNDTINGQNILYSPIKNASTIQQQFNSKNIISLENTSDKYFAGFSIKLDKRVPYVGNGPSGEHVYIDTNGDLVIDAINLESNELIQIEIVQSGTIYNTQLGQIL